MTDPNAIHYTDEDHEVDMGLEAIEAEGLPVVPSKVAARAGINKLTQRLAYLRRQIAELLQHDETPEQEAEHHRLIREFHRAEELLAHYRRQHEQRN